MSKLPRHIEKVGVPPVKCQGIKTKLVNFIAENIEWDGMGKWIEPFLGSGVVLFNIQPERALVSDTNKHIINLYQQIQSGQVDEVLVKEYLKEADEKLKNGGQDYYMEVRKRFNQTGSPLDFLFLNRSCFNGMMRFNSKGEYNVPFGHKPERFAQAYITKIVHQISWVKKMMKGRDWTFEVADWRMTLLKARANDFVYLDPPYIGRHTDYFNQWTEKDAVELAELAQKLPCGFALSMWLENKYRRNDHIDNFWNGLEIRTFNHFYHLGSSEDLRNEMQEALVLPAAHLRNNDQLLKRKTTMVQFQLFE
ncbi:MAG: Dam family site-specific DNA-(adenine-N6)-methyltransferase [Saprospiraceae bacterium]|nr:Dam family site-specific DNA-(adenine-N6)-methyltransferase [Saprospiraceae bacterium]